jgi:hypothetical protein
MCIRTEPLGHFLYTENIDATGSADITLQSLSGFSVDNTGALAHGSSVTLHSACEYNYFWACNSSLRKISLCGYGVYANGIVAGASIAQLADSQCSRLPHMTPEPWHAAAPRSMLPETPVIDPGGHFLFASDTRNKAIVAFKVDSATGALTPLGTPTLLTDGAVTLTIVKAP